MPMQVNRLRRVAAVHEREHHGTAGERRQRVEVASEELHEVRSPLAARVAPHGHVLDALEQLPNVGPSLAADLRLIGINEPRELRGKDAFVLYQRLCAATGQRQDPCGELSMHTHMLFRRADPREPELPPARARPARELRARPTRVRPIRT